jgi:hypothetical protein
MERIQKSEAASATLTELKATREAIYSASLMQFQCGIVETISATPTEVQPTVKIVVKEKVTPVPTPPGNAGFFMTIGAKEASHYDVPLTETERMVIGADDVFLRQRYRFDYQSEDSMGAVESCSKTIVDANVNDSG